MEVYRFMGYACICAECGIAFTARNKNQVYHSRECSVLSYAKERRRSQLYDIEDGTKVCNCCNIEKPANMFFHKKKRCKQCYSEMAKEARQKKNESKLNNNKYDKKTIIQARKRKCNTCGIAKNLYQFPRKPKSINYMERVKTCDECTARAKNEHKDKQKEAQRLKKEELKMQKYEYLLSMPFEERVNYQHNKQFSKRIKNTYGISIERYEYLLAEQNGLCAICGNPPEKYARLFVDHDHETGSIRGLLCDHCNWGLGQFRESQQNLHNAIRYLEKHTWI